MGKFRNIGFGLMCNKDVGRIAEFNFQLFICNANLIRLVKGNFQKGIVTRSIGQIRKMFCEISGKVIAIEQCLPGFHKRRP